MCALQRLIYFGKIYVFFIWFCFCSVSFWLAHMLQNYILQILCDFDLWFINEASKYVSKHSTHVFARSVYRSMRPKGFPDLQCGFGFSFIYRMIWDDCRMDYHLYIWILFWWFSFQKQTTKSHSKCSTCLIGQFWRGFFVFIWCNGIRPAGPGSATQRQIQTDMISQNPLTIQCNGFLWIWNNGPLSNNNRESIRTQPHHCP